MRMKKSCLTRHGQCRALLTTPTVNTVRGKCLLGYKIYQGYCYRTLTISPYPIEICPKPMTWEKFDQLKNGEK